MTIEFNLQKALASNAWPFKEAEALLKRLNNKLPEKGYVLFESGYGPSGLPHIGTFAEVFRTTMVRHAFERISGMPTKLFAFSDDMDGLRKVPDNIPNPENFKQYTGSKDDARIGGVMLTTMPDPFGTHPSFGQHNNDRLKAFLDQYGFDYEFKSATECYTSGMFDEMLLKVAKNHQKICDVVLPALGGIETDGMKRVDHYSPFLPVHPETKRTLHVAVEVVDGDKGIIRYQDPLNNNEWRETEVTGGKTKLQWRADWGMRWAALGVDYEMHGKDLTPSAELSSKICRVIGGNPPQIYKYELFLDGEGKKISKSKGNGLSMEEWLTYGTPESLSTYLFASPNKQKRLYFDVIPKSVDEYITFQSKQEGDQIYSNPAAHIHNFDWKPETAAVSYSLLLNLVSASNAHNKDVLWGFIKTYAPGTSPQNAPMLDKLVGYAIKYYDDFVKPNKKFREPTDQEKAAILELRKMVAALPENPNAEEAMQCVYDSAKAHGYTPETMREWFKAIYEVLLGQSEGPRIGTFIALYGRDNSVKLIDEVMSGKQAAA